MKFDGAFHVANNMSCFDCVCMVFCEVEGGFHVVVGLIL